MITTAEPICKTDNSWKISGHVQSVSTNRTEGQIKLQIAPREILQFHLKLKGD